MIKYSILVIAILITVLIVRYYIQQSQKERRNENKDMKDTKVNNEITSHGASSVLICWQAQTNHQEDGKAFKKLLTKIGIEYKELDSQEWVPQKSTIGGIRDYKLSKIAPSGPAWNAVLLHLHSKLGNSVAVELSRSLDTSVILFLEFAQSAWGYCIYHKGIIMDKFCNDPKAVDLESTEWKGNIERVSDLLSVQRSKIEPYIKHLDELEDFDKAFNDDEFYIDDHWVRVDFMKRLGIVYPDKGQWFYIIEKGINNF